jgi:hypothetical protein
MKNNIILVMFENNKLTASIYLKTKETKKILDFMVKERMI